MAGLTQEADFIVVGSGCAGAMAAQTLVEAGAQVLMLDGGIKDSRYQQLIPDKTFLAIRQTARDQHKYFLGDEFEGVPLGDVKTGEHLTPPRKFMVARTDEWLPVVSDHFLALESLALGGLGSGWGLGCCTFSKPELEAAGLNPEAMRCAYDVVSRRIGISGSRDDAAPYTAACVADLMPPIEMDPVGRNLQANYFRKRDQLNRDGFFLGRPSLALLTQPKGSRGSYQYKELDFYSDHDGSAYRPRFTIEELMAKKNFSYRGGLYVHSFKEDAGGIMVHCRTLDDNQHVQFNCRKLVLAASCLSTARIVLRSFEAFGVRLPVISNPYSYLPAVQPALLGRETEDARIGFAQLSLFYDAGRNNMDVAMASVYGYRSLMAFRLLKQTPLGIKTGFAFLRYLMPAFTILGLFHPERGGDGKSLHLQRDSGLRSGDVLQVDYRLTPDEQRRVAHNERQFARALRKLNCFVIKKIDPGAGSGIHYAGTLPFSERDERLRTAPDGRLGGTRNVFVADASAFCYLPGKGLTLSLMANAHNVATRALQS